MKERGLRSPQLSRAFMLGGVYVIYDDGRPLVEAYDGPQIVGMDLHRRRSVLVRMAEDGRKLGTARIANSPARLAAEIRRSGPQPQVVLEACYGWYWAADALAKAGAEVHLAHPLGVKAFSCRRVKNDELDARDLADLLRMGRLAEAWIAPPEIRELREITRYRGKLVQLRTSCKDQVHGVLAKLGIEVTCPGHLRRLGNPVAGRAGPAPALFLEGRLAAAADRLADRRDHRAGTGKRRPAGRPRRLPRGPASARCSARSSSPRSATSPDSGTRPGCARGPG